MRTRILKVNAQKPEPAVIHEAAGCLRRGGLVAFPTETVYGLGANLDDPQAIQELYQVKARPFEKKVTIHVYSADAVKMYGVEVTPLAKRLMEIYWPGPLTLVLRRPDGSTLGFRMPDHRVALALLTESQVPVVAPSANLSGNPPPRTAEDVLRDLSDKIDIILDAGPTPGGIESTVLDLAADSPEILRQGALVEEVQQLLEEVKSKKEKGKRTR